MKKMKNGSRADYKFLASDFDLGWVSRIFFWIRILTIFPQIVDTTVKIELNDSIKISTMNSRYQAKLNGSMIANYWWSL